MLGIVQTPGRVDFPSLGELVEFSVASDGFGWVALGFSFSENLGTPPASQRETGTLKNRHPTVVKQP